MEAFSSYLKEVRGSPACTIRKKLAHVNMFSLFCRRRHRPAHRARLRDIDEFIVWCGQRYARTTVSDICCSLRSYQRFLCASGRISRNLAGSIIAPLVRTAERPHRSLPWDKVQRILRAVSTAIFSDGKTGRIDHVR
jgi:site-specific recombinase XerD